VTWSIAQGWSDESGFWIVCEVFGIFESANENALDLIETSTLRLRLYLGEERGSGYVSS